MKVIINGVELDIKRTLRTDMIYEDITGKTLDVNKINSKALINLFIANVIAAQQRYNEQPNQHTEVMSKEQVFAWLEEDPIREMYVSMSGKEYVDEYIKYLNLVQEYYKNESKKTHKKSKNNVTIESVDDEKKD